MFGLKIEKFTKGLKEQSLIVQGEKCKLFIKHDNRKFRNEDFTSICVVNYKTKDFIKNCIESIRNFTQEPYRIIVVDNGSWDDSTEYLRDQEDVFLVINTLKEKKPAVMHGLGLGIVAEFVNSRYILILDSDTFIYRKGWLNNLIKGLNNEIKCMGPEFQYKYKNYRMVHPCCMLFEFFYYKELGMTFKYFGPPPYERDDGCDISIKFVDNGYKLKFLDVSFPGPLEDESRPFYGMRTMDIKDLEGNYFINHFGRGTLGWKSKISKEQFSNLKRDYLAKCATILKNEAIVSLNITKDTN